MTSITDYTGYEQSANLFNVGNYIWDVPTLAWVKDTGAGGGVGNVFVTNFPASYAVTGPLTDVQLRATPVPISGPLTDVQLRATPVPISAVNLDVALSTRLKPADTLTAVATVTNLAQLGGQAVTMGTGVRTAGTQRVTIATDDSVPITNAFLDVLLSTRLKAGDTLTGVTTLTNQAQMNGQAIAMGTGVRSAGTQRVTIATDDLVLVGGDIGADAIDSGNPVKIGGIARSALTATVAALRRVNGMFDIYGRFVVAKKDTWSKNHVPAAATQATIAQASAGVGIKNVCTSITVTLSSAAAPTVGVVTFNLRDGASGAGGVLWAAKGSLTAVAGDTWQLTLSDLWIEGTAATAMTLETAAAPAANVQATVAITGTTTV